MLRKAFLAIAAIYTLLSLSMANGLGSASGQETRDRLKEEWRSWSTDQRRFYVVGVMDTWVNVSLLAEKAEGKGKSDMVGIAILYKHLSDCISARHISYADAHAIVHAYIIRAEGKRIEALASTIFGALWEACEPGKE
jgi:hypothetical protein